MKTPRCETTLLGARRISLDAKSISSDVEVASTSKALPALPLHTRCIESFHRKGRWAFHAWWAWEILAASISSAAAIALLAVLVSADQRQQQTWPIGGTQLTLNTIVAAIGTVQRSALLLAVTGALSQQMWNWFAHRRDDDEPPSRQLKDLPVLSESGTNLWYCFRLLWHTKGRYLASLGASIIILAILFDALLQQVISVYDRPQQSVLGGSNFSVENALPQVLGLDITVLADDTSTFNAVLSSKLQSAIISGALGDDAQAPGAICPTGECTWPETPSLAFDGGCVPMNFSKTISSNETCERILTYTIEATNPGLQDADPVLKQTNFTSCNGTFNLDWRFEDSGNSDPRAVFDFVSYGAEYFDQTSDNNEPSIDDYNFSAFRCQVHFSMISYTAVSSKGSLIHNYSTILTEIEDVSPPPEDPSSGIPSNNYTIKRSPTQWKKVDFSPVNITTNAWYSFQSTMNQSLNSHCYGEAFSGTWPRGCSSAQAWDLWAYTDPSGSMDARIRGVADSLANWMRTTQASQTLPSTQYAPTVTIQVPTVAVRWAWLTYPFGLQLIGLLFLAFTMYTTSRLNVRPWKGNRIPLLLAEFDDDIKKRAFGGLGNRTGLDDRLGETRVRLDYDGGNRIVFRRAE